MQTYAYSRITVQSPSQNMFPLHSHDGYELYLFLYGDCEYIVEGITYPLSPYDLIIISNSELHRVHHKSPSPYSRIVISIDHQFFEEMDCVEYEKIFKTKQIGRNSKIGCRQMEQTGLKDAFMRLDKYYNESKKTESLIKGVIVEILHIMNNIDIISDDASENILINSITEYLTANLSSSISLQDIADKFYISKYHLCRIFKASTGLTVNNYIVRKRIIAVKSYRKSGLNLSNACLEAGFSSYSSFYRAYVKEFGHSPRIDM